MANLATLLSHFTFPEIFSSPIVYYSFLFCLFLFGLVLLGFIKELIAPEIPLHAATGGLVPTEKILVNGQKIKNINVGNSLRIRASDGTPQMTPLVTPANGFIGGENARLWERRLSSNINNSIQLGHGRSRSVSDLSNQFTNYKFKPDSQPIASNSSSPVRHLIGPTANYSGASSPESCKENIVTTETNSRSIISAISRSVSPEIAEITDLSTYDRLLNLSKQINFSEIQFKSTISHELELGTIEPWQADVLWMRFRTNRNLKPEGFKLNKPLQINVVSDFKPIFNVQSHNEDTQVSSVEATEHSSIENVVKKSIPKMLSESIVALPIQNIETSSIKISNLLDSSENTTSSVKTSNLVDSFEKVSSRIKTSNLVDSADSVAAVILNPTAVTREINSVSFQATKEEEVKDNLADTSNRVLSNNSSSLIEYNKSLLEIIHQSRMTAMSQIVALRKNCPEVTSPIKLQILNDSTDDVKSVASDISAILCKKSDSANVKSESVLRDALNMVTANMQALQRARAQK